MRNHDQIPLGKALLWIFLWTMAISGSAWMGWLYYLHLNHAKMSNDEYRIIAIIQSTPQSEGLKTVYLAELLNLSLDRPVNLYQFNTSEAERLLLASPLIKAVTLKKIHPGTLYIDYQIRTPVAFLADYTNTAIDEEGYLFPVSPFYTPKKLPTIYLGLEDLEKNWGMTLIDDPRMQLALDVIKATHDGLLVKKIDVSQSFADSDGQRQIILGIEEASQFFLLRLHSEEYKQNIANYLVLRENLFQNNADVGSGKTSIIDFRVPHLAFIKKEF